MTVIIRPYTESDFAAVTAIWLDSWRSTGVAAPVALDELRERWPRELAKGWSVAVVEQKPTIMGFMATHEDRIEQLFIAPAYQSLGLGKQLLDYAKEQMPEGFHLTTALDSRAANFYAREGLAPGVETTHPRFGHRVIAYRWR